MGYHDLKSTDPTGRLVQMESALAGVALSPERQFHYWRGASGCRYVHTVYSLFECPEMPEANYVIVRRGADGSRAALRIGAVESDAPSLNLADIRRRAAQLGAHEIHLHLLSETVADRRRVSDDLRVSLLAELAPEPSPVPALLN